MPLDYRIPAQAAEPTGFSPLKALAQGDIYAAQQDKRRSDQAEAQRQRMIDQVVQQHPDDPDAAIAFLRPRDWRAAATLEKMITEQRTKTVELRGKELEALFKQGQISAQQAEAENKALHSKALEDWAELYDIDPKGAAEKARFLLGPQKLAELEGQAAQRAEAARHNVATETNTVRGQDISAETARSGQAVTMRGQDIGASTARRGQDITARGQDISAGTAAARLALDKAEANKPGAAGKAGPPVAAIINQIETLSKRINTSAGGPTSYAKGLMNRGLATAQMNNDMSEYQSLVSGMIPMVARAVGHTGVLTQQDVDSVRDLFPKPQDNQALAQNKIRRIKELIGSTGAPAEAGGGKVALTAEELIKKYGGQ